jgi:hypothetical protein
MVTRNLALKRVAGLTNVTVFPHTAVNAFSAVGVEIDTDGEKRTLEPFQTVILAFGLLPAPRPDEEIENLVSRVEIIGDAQEVQDIFTATQAGYKLALKY